MNPELEALLKRIEVAGGPVREGWSFDKPVWDAVFSEPDKYGYTTFTIGPKEDVRVGPESDALIIHALKLDAQRRGCAVLATQGAATLRSGAGATNPVDWKVLIWPRDKPSIDYEAAEHESEPCAWALAWLALFEQVPV